jgi:RsiW-degrading membrane proteinase PrsW (M82 family)
LQRVVYCPTEDNLEEAQILAKTGNIPIQIGDSKKTQDLEFDRTSVSILLIPAIFNLTFNNKVKLGVATRISLYDEWNSYTRDSVSVIIKSGLFGTTHTEKPLYTEINSVVFVARFKEIGSNTFTIFNNNLVVASETISVLKDFDETNGNN